jgi:aspartyl-tRNA(Asn)/glutamyl-tRNA(Gln) amidotransferase subunit A
VRDDYLRCFHDVDVIAGPTTPTVAFRLGEKVDDPVTMYLSDVYTVGVNLAGLPAISLPAGFDGGLPIGLQLVGGYFEEARLLNVAHQLQRSSDIHRRRPPSPIPAPT